MRLREVGKSNKVTPTELREDLRCHCVICGHFAMHTSRNIVPKQIHVSYQIASLLLDSHSENGTTTQSPPLES